MNDDIISTHKHLKYIYENADYKQLYMVFNFKLPKTINDFKNLGIFKSPMQFLVFL